MEAIKMWDKSPRLVDEEPVLEYYKAENKTTDGTVIIFPGGAYVGRASHEGDGYAKFLNSIGIDCFVLEYRVSPNRFPTELLDARRAVRWVRYHAKEYGINPQKVAVMGSSAGGHLAALVSTYREQIEFENIDEIDKCDYIPNFQILCYPVISMTNLEVAHTGSIRNLLGDGMIHKAVTVDPVIIADEKTPKAFIWHTSNDEGVNVINSLLYGEKLRKLEIPFEMHIFPEGRHGYGLAPDNQYIARWSEMLKKWLEYNKYFD